MRHILCFQRLCTELFAIFVPGLSSSRDRLRPCAARQFTNSPKLVQVPMLQLLQAQRQDSRPNHVSVADQKVPNRPADSTKRHHTKATEKYPPPLSIKHVKQSNHSCQSTPFPFLVKAQNKSSHQTKETKKDTN